MMNMVFERKLAIPMEVKEMYPLNAKMAELVEARDIETKDILSGKSDKLMLIIGPCSADNEDSVLDYISRLVKMCIRDRCCRNCALRSSCSEIRYRLFLC